MGRDLTSLETLGLAIRSEEDAAEFYSAVAKLVKNKLVRDKYETLAREEIGHRQILVNLYKKFSGDPQPPKIKGSPKTAETGFPIMALDSIEDMLNFAIIRENEANKFYRNAAKKTTDITAKRILEYLADIEHGHEIMLKAEFEAYKRDKGWYIDEDIQLVGP